MNTIADNINSIRFRIRAEAVVNDLISKGFSFDDIIIRHKSAHKQYWQNDILHCESKGGKIYIDLSRNGLFDALPEYLFLKPIDDHKLRQEEKQKILAFNAQQRIYSNILFNPIENAVFEKRVDIERFENEVLALLNSYSHEGLVDFYKIDNQLTYAYHVKLVKIIPLLYSIVGDFPLTARCLEYLLDNPVSFEISEVLKDVQSPALSGTPSQEGLGSSACGETMILNGIIQESVPTILFSVGPVDVKDVEKYLEGGEKRTLIKYFSNYFLPLEYDFDLVIDVIDRDASFALNNSFLGYNSSTN
jgi:hypothetical protein